MAVAIQIQTTPQDLLNPGSDWSTVRKAILRPVPGDAYGNPLIELRAEAFEWDDVTLFGWGNVDDSMQRLQAEIQRRGSDLYAYCLLTQTRFDFLGVKVVTYRLLLLHSVVALLEWAVAILAIGFAAVIFIQYVTTGQAPALRDLQGLWGSAVTSVGSAGAGIVGAATSAYITAAIAAGAIAIALGVAAKQAGTRAPAGPRAPSGSIGVRGGGISARVGA